MHDHHPINSKLIAAVEVPYKGSECHRLAARNVIITSDVVILYHMVDDVISNNIKHFIHKVVMQGIIALNISVTQSYF